MVFCKDIDTAIDIPFDWTGVIGGGVTLTSVTHVVPTGMTLVSQATDTVNGKSTVRVNGGSNGVIYVVEAIATLSSGELIAKRGPVRVVSA